MQLDILAFLQKYGKNTFVVLLSKLGIMDKPLLANYKKKEFKKTYQI